jgi:hypothetical protein
MLIEEKGSWLRTMHLRTKPSRMSLSRSWPAGLSAPFANSPAIYRNKKTDHLQTELIECKKRVFRVSHNARNVSCSLNAINARHAHRTYAECILCIYCVKRVGVASNALFAKLAFVAYPTHPRSVTQTQTSCTLRREAESRLVVLARPRAPLSYVLMFAATISVAREKRVLCA